MLFIDRPCTFGVAVADARVNASPMWRDSMATFATYSKRFTKRPRHGLLGLTT